MRALPAATSTLANSSSLPVAQAWTLHSPAGEEALVPATSVSWRVFKNPVRCWPGGVAAVIHQAAIGPCGPACGGIRRTSRLQATPAARRRRRHDHGLWPKPPGRGDDRGRRARGDPASKVTRPPVRPIVPTTAICSPGCRRPRDSAPSKPIIAMFGRPWPRRPRPGATEPRERRLPASTAQTMRRPAGTRRWPSSTPKRDLIEPPPSSCSSSATSSAKAPVFQPRAAR